MFLVENVERLNTPNAHLVVFGIDQPQPVFEVDRVKIPANIQSLAR
jgi:hypothetical protein